jgi:hypothetical protein
MMLLVLVGLLMMLLLLLLLLLLQLVMAVGVICMAACRGCSQGPADQRNMGSTAQTSNE